MANRAELTDNRTYFIANRAVSVVVNGGLGPLRLHDRLCLGAPRAPRPAGTIAVPADSTPPYRPPARCSGLFAHRPGSLNCSSLGPLAMLLALGPFSRAPRAGAFGLDQALGPFALSWILELLALGPLAMLLAALYAVVRLRGCSGNVGSVSSRAGPSPSSWT